MKPPSFDYADPDDIDAVLELLAEHGDDAVVIAGGQSLIPLLNLRLARPALVVDPGRVDTLREFVVDAQGLRAGAMARMLDVEEALAAATVPGLTESLAHVAHRPIRARATLGGSMAHADPAAELPALMLAADGAVVLRSRDRGERVVPVRQFLHGPLMTDRQPDELLVEVRIPRHPGRLVVRELAPRPGDFALVGCVAGFATVAGRIDSPAIVVFGAGGTAMRCAEAEQALLGQEPSSVVLAEAASIVRDTVEARDDSHASARYRRHVAAILVARSLASVA